ncbi:MAG: DMT family transporter [Pseudomonadota bacterium]
MRIFVLTTLAMIAFAANSVLNRAVLADGLIDPLGFAAIRIAAGAAVLALALYLKERRLALRPHQILAPIGLGVYMIAFSLAYLALDAGLGALLLFGTVQLAMFGASVLRGNRPLLAEVLGSAIAFGGLVYLLAPSLGGGPVWPAFAMILAGLGWAGFTLAGRTAPHPLPASAASFLVLVPIAVLAWVLFGELRVSVFGFALAILSGAVTSGVGYLIWYAVLPHLAVPTAALVQLTVPVIAILGGVLLLAEALTMQIAIACALVVAGVALGVEARRRAPD